MDTESGTAFVLIGKMDSLVINFENFSSKNRRTKP